MTQALPFRTIQKQLRGGFLVLVFITCVNAAFFLQNLQQLVSSYRAVAQGQHIIALVSDLERGFFEENQLRDLQEEEGLAQKNLSQLRSTFKKDFKEIAEELTDKSELEAIAKIEKNWHSAHSERATLQLLSQTHKFIAAQQEHIKPLETNAGLATRALTIILGVYICIFGVTVIIMNQYLKRRVFAPLRRLSDKMHHFQAGNQLPAQNAGYDEISDLESQFYKMADRVSVSFSDLKELDKAKTDFISIASHELRTPMTAVKGSLSLLLSGGISNLPGEIKEILTIAETETDRLIRLINDILDLTKMETKKMSLNKKWNDLGQIIETAVKGISGFLEVTQVKATIEHYDTPIQVNADGDRIQQVVTNLLSNAVKFSPTGSTVKLSYYLYDRGAVVTVEDSGPGIKPEDQSHMFEKFRSTDSGKSKIIKGTGLGLPICKALIDQHNGQIGVQSEVGHGSTFYFTLPEVKSNQGVDEESSDRRVA